MTTFPAHIMKAVLSSKAVFVKNENYVPAHLNAELGKTLADHWSEQKFLEYMDEEARMNCAGGQRGSFTMFIGDAAFHSFVFHLRYYFCPASRKFIYNQI